MQSRRVHGRPFGRPGAAGGGGWAALYAYNSPLDMESGRPLDSRHRRRRPRPAGRLRAGPCQPTRPAAAILSCAPVGCRAPQRRSPHAREPCGRACRAGALSRAGAGGALRGHARAAAEGGARRIRSPGLVRNAPDGARSAPEPAQSALVCRLVRHRRARRARWAIARASASLPRPSARSKVISMPTSADSRRAIPAAVPYLKPCGRMRSRTARPPRRAGGVELPAPVRELMRRTAAVMTGTAYWI